MVNHNQTAAGGPGAGLLGSAWTTTYGTAHPPHQKRNRPTTANPPPGPEPEAPPEANGLTATPQQTATTGEAKGLTPADPAAEVGDLGERLRSAEGEAAGKHPKKTLRCAPRFPGGPAQRSGPRRTAR
jgi:hypothetical protein